MTDVYAYHDVSGVTALVPENHVNHPIFGPHLTVVRNDKERGSLAEIVDRNTANSTVDEPVVEDDLDSEEVTDDEIEEK